MDIIEKIQGKGRWHGLCSEALVLFPDRMQAVRLWQATGCLDLAWRSVSRVAPRIFLGALAVSLLLITSGPQARAQSASGLFVNAPILTYSLASTPLRFDELRAWVGDFHLSTFAMPDLEADRITTLSLLNRPTRTQREPLTSIMLLRSRFDSIHEYDACAGLQARFGNLLDDEGKRLSKLRGGGIQEPGRLYLTLSFRF